MFIKNSDRIINTLQLNNSIHIWTCVLNHLERTVNNYYSLLSSDEKIRAEKFKIREIRNRWIITRGLLRVLLSHYQECEPQQIEFNYNEFGKPFVSADEAGNSISFNLSDSDDLVVYVFAKTGSVGIDVEKVTEINNLSEVIDLCFHKDEKKWFNDLPLDKRNNIFYKIWTTKEAYIKAIGKGLSFSPDKINLLMDSNASMRYKNIIGDENHRRWNSISFEPHPDYISTVVIDNNDFKIEYIKVDSQQIIEQDNYLLKDLIIKK